MDASKVTIGAKTYDLNYLKPSKKTALRRKLVVEYIQSKPAGEIITIAQLQNVIRLSSSSNVHSFIKRMVRDGVIGQYKSDKPGSHYYSVLGSVRIKSPKRQLPITTTAVLNQPNPEPSVVPDLNGFVKSMKTLGIKFTITITNEEK